MFPERRINLDHIRLEFEFDVSWIVIVHKKAPDCIAYRRSTTFSSWYTNPQISNNPSAVFGSTLGGATCSCDDGPLVLTDEKFDTRCISVRNYGFHASHSAGLTRADATILRGREPCTLRPKSTLGSARSQTDSAVPVAFLDQGGLLIGRSLAVPGSVLSGR